MSGAEWEVLQQRLALAYWPWIELWLVAYVVGAVFSAILITFLVVTRSLLTRIA